MLRWGAAFTVDAAEVTVASSVVLPEEIGTEASMARRWTTAEDRVLYRLYPQGVPIREIASALGRSADAVCERRRALALPARPRSRPWSPREDDLLRVASSAGLPAATLVGALSRDAEQIRRRRRVLLGTALRLRAYTPAEDEAIRACWKDDLDVQHLALALGRSPGTIRLRAQKLGCFQPVRRPRWREHEDAAVHDGYKQGLTCAQIAAELPGRTVSAVAARAGKLGLATYARIWTPRDDRILRALTRDAFELERAAQILARTPEAVRARARKLGLAPPRSRRTHQTPRRWTCAEDEQLRLHAGHNPAILAELLDRSPEAVVQRLRRLGLREVRERSPHHPAPGRRGPTPGERATVARELRTGGPRRQLALARRLGRQPAEIRALAPAYPPTAVGEPATATGSQAAAPPGAEGERKTVAGRR